MNLYEAIYHRMSVRAFRNRSLGQDQMDHIRRFLRSVKGISDDIATKTEIIDQEEKKNRMHGLFGVKAPHYLVFYSEKKESYLENAGFILEQVVLYMTLRGIGSCYQGGMKINLPSEIRQLGMTAVMVVAFGEPEETCLREPELARRVPLSDIVLCKEELNDDLRQVMAAARLAPSSMNRQPWKLVMYHNRIHLFQKKNRVSWNDMQRFDMGIILYHIVAAAEERWLVPEIVRLDSIVEQKMRDYQYITTIKLTGV